MKIIDTNGVSYIFENNVVLDNDYYLVPDVVEEVELTQLVHGQRIPSRLLEIEQSALFDEALYLNYYNKTLNKYGGRSFYNMTGFGDVSIIATLHMFMDVFDQQKRSQLFDLSEQIVIYTGDSGLTSKITTEFNGRDIVVKPVTDIT